LVPDPRNLAQLAGEQDWLWRRLRLSHKGEHFCFRDLRNGSNSTLEFAKTPQIV